MKRRVIGIVIVVAVIAALAFLSTIGGNDDDNTLVLSGTIEATEAQLGFRIPGLLTERLVGEGQQVEQGQLLARLDNTDQQIAVSQAQANVDLAQAVLAELEAGSRPEDIRSAAAQVAGARAGLDLLENGSRQQEINGATARVEQARAAIEQAEVGLELANADFSRVAELFDAGVLTRQQFDSAAAGRDAASHALAAAVAAHAAATESLSIADEGFRDEQVEQARAQLGAVSAGYTKAVAGPRPETIEQARARVRIAEETLNAVRQQLANTELYCPIGGTVQSKSAEPGEYLNPGAPVVRVADLGVVWLRAYVAETDLGRLQPGMELFVTTDTYPDRQYRGRLSFISDSAEFTPKFVQTTQERVKLVYMIKVELDNPDFELKPGMPADVVIDRAG